MRCVCVLSIKTHRRFKSNSQGEQMKNLVKITGLFVGIFLTQNGFAATPISCSNADGTVTAHGTDWEKDMVYVINGAEYHSQELIIRSNGFQLLDNKSVFPPNFSFAMEKYTFALADRQ